MGDGADARRQRQPWFELSASDGERSLRLPRQRSTRGEHAAAAWRRGCARPDCRDVRRGVRARRRRDRHRASRRGRPTSWPSRRAASCCSSAADAWTDGVALVEARPVADLQPQRALVAVQRRPRHSTPHRRQPRREDAQLVGERHRLQHLARPDQHEHSHRQHLGERLDVAACGRVRGRSTRLPRLATESFGVDEVETRASTSAELDGRGPRRARRPARRRAARGCRDRRVRPCRAGTRPGRPRRAARRRHCLGRCAPQRGPRPCVAAHRRAARTPRTAGGARRLVTWPAPLIGDDDGVQPPRDGEQVLERQRSASCSHPATIARPPRRRPTRRNPAARGRRRRAGRRCAARRRRGGVEHDAAGGAAASPRRPPARDRGRTTSGSPPSSKPAPTASCRTPRGRPLDRDMTCSSSTMSTVRPSNPATPSTSTWSAGRARKASATGLPPDAGAAPDANSASSGLPSARRVIAVTSPSATPAPRSSSPTARRRGGRRGIVGLASRAIVGRHRQARRRQQAQPRRRRQEPADEGERRRPGPLDVVEHDDALHDRRPRPPWRARRASDRGRNPRHGDPDRSAGGRRRMATARSCARRRLDRARRSRPIGTSLVASSSAAHHVTKPSRSDDAKRTHSASLGTLHCGPCQVRLADPWFAAQHDERRRGVCRPQLTDPGDLGVTPDRRLVGAVAGLPARGRTVTAQTSRGASKPRSISRSWSDTAGWLRLPRTTTVVASTNTSPAGQTSHSRDATTTGSPNRSPRSDITSPVDIPTRIGDPAAVAASWTALAGAHQVVCRRQQRQHPVAGALHDAARRTRRRRWRRGRRDGGARRRRRPPRRARACWSSRRCRSPGRWQCAAHRAAAPCRVPA